MTSFQRVIKWSHEGFKYFLIKILIFCFIHVGPLFQPLSSSEVLKLSLGSESANNLYRTESEVLKLSLDR